MIILIPLDPLRGHRILFPNQSIHPFNLHSPHSNQLIDRIREAEAALHQKQLSINQKQLSINQKQPSINQKQPSINQKQLSPSNHDLLQLACLPIQTTQHQNQNHSGWGCLAIIKSHRLIIIDQQDSILQLDLIGTHRFKLNLHSLIPSKPTTILESLLPDQISIHPEIHPNPITKLDAHSILQFKSLTIRFFHLLNHLNQSSLNQHLPQPSIPTDLDLDSTLSQFDRSIQSLDLPQISFLIDLIVRDLQLIPWHQKLYFLSYYQSRSKLHHFNQLISKLSSQLQSILYLYTSNSPLKYLSSSHPPSPSPSPSLPIHHFRALLYQNPLNLIQLLPLLPSSHPPLTPFNPIIIRPHIPPSNHPPNRKLLNFKQPSSKSNHSSPLGPHEEIVDEELERLNQRIQSIGMTQEAFEICTKELKRLNSIPPSSLEHSLIRNYLEIMLELPWSKSTTIDSDHQIILSDSFLSDARHQLDLDHFGMIKLKQRLIEFLAVIKLGAHLQTRSIHPKASQPPSTISQSDRTQESKITPVSIDDSLPPKFPILPPNPSLDQPSTKNTTHQDSSELPQDPILKHLKESKRAPILLLVGPPGVGKTSIVKSIAKALRKKFYRISLGGVKDESEIRGHRRTYVGSMPGAIVQALRRVAVNDPVILLDEIDKVGNRGFNGDPASALLEVLDPEQNTSFVDHYINTPIDLSSVLFIATANDSSTISLPLLDRLEVVPVDGYLLDEKLEIAKRNLIPKQLEYYRLKPNQLILEDPDRILKQIITGYTHESGVRSLEREIGNLCRAKVLEFVESLGRSKRSDVAFDRFTAKLTLDDLPKILGPVKYETEVSAVKLRPGVAIGLAYQGSGNGSILYIEATSFPGHGALKLTGSLGEVIKESAELAISWIKSHSTSMNLKIKDFNAIDLHIHFPSGSVRKDGPSAGVALVLALVSLLSGIEIDHRLAVTGEISLRGQVLPVGGIREKVLAANRSGIQEIILPHRNAKEIESDPHLNQIPDSMIQIRYVSSLEDLIRSVFKDRRLWMDDEKEEDRVRTGDSSIVDSQTRSVLGSHHPFADYHPIDSFDRFIRFSPDSLL